MGAKTAISVEEYLRTSYPDLDREYRDGEVVERALPDRLHSATQGLLAAFLIALRATCHLFVYPEMRVKLRTGRYLIPDLSVYHRERPEKLVPDTPPLIAIEILSPDDRMSEVLAKLEEYRQWGVPHVWLADPHARRLYTCEAGLVEVPALKIPELSIEVKPSDIFEQA
jgi:Uma2 family endonuclease